MSEDAEMPSLSTPTPMSLNHLTLSEFSLPPRVPARPPELRQPDFDDLYDHDTLAYDAVSLADRTIIISPPLSNETWTQIVESAHLDGQPVSRLKHTIYKSLNAHKLVINAGQATQLTLFNKAITPTAPDREFQGLERIIYTKQRDNEIQWIADWIDWHVTKHGAQGILIYDNGSTRYDPVSLQLSLQRSDSVVRVINAPFKWGPTAYKGSGWDSDFFQYCMVEHARYAYAGSQSLFIHVDVDELIVSRDSTSIFGVTPPPASLSLFSGKWVNVNGTVNPPTVTHAHHNQLDRVSRCPNKWLANLNALPDAVFLRIHDSQGKGVAKTELTRHRYLHFRNISTNWKYSRTTHRHADAARYIDFTLSAPNYDEIFDGDHKR